MERVPDNSNMQNLHMTAMYNAYNEYCFCKKKRRNHYFNYLSGKDSNALNTTATNQMLNKELSLSAGLKPRWD
jgi:predicted ATPase with chaperone activity